MKQCCILVSTTLSMLLIGVGPASAQRLKIEVGGANFRPFPVAAPALVAVKAPGRPGKKLVRELTGVLQTGVDIARVLELVPPKSYLDPEKESWVTPTYANWTNVGSSGLVRGGVELDGDQVKLTMRFFDVVSQRELLSRTYEQPRATAGRAVHRFLDEIIETLTGEPGIFSSRLAFVKKTKEGKAVFISDVDGRNQRRITDAAELSLLPEWDRSGSFVLFTSYLKGNPDLFRINVASSELEWLSNKRGLNTGASVSPNGKRIALTLSLDGNTEIYVMNWGGKNLTRLTDSWGQDVSPTWSPDGGRIAFVSSRSGQPHIYTMNVDGSNPTRLTFQGSYNQEPDWSPRADGKIAFTARDEFIKYDVFLVDPKTGEVTRLTQDEGNNMSPSHSPDGHHVVFTSTRPPGAGSKLYVMDIDGDNQRRLSRGGEHETPSWSARRGY